MVGSGQESLWFQTAEILKGAAGKLVGIGRTYLLQVLWHGYTFDY